MEIKNEDYWILVDYINRKVKHHSGPLGLGKELALSNLRSAVNRIPKEYMEYKVRDILQTLSILADMPESLRNYRVRDFIDAVNHALSQGDIR